MLTLREGSHDERAEGVPRHLFTFSRRALAKWQNPSRHLPLSSAAPQRYPREVFSGRRAHRGPPAPQERDAGGTNSGCDGGPFFRARKDVDVDFPGEHIVGLTAVVAKFVAAHRMPFEDDHQVPGSRNGVRLNEDISSSRSRRTAFSSTSLSMRERISAFSARSRASSASRGRRRNEYVRVDLVPSSVDRWVPRLQLCRCRLLCPKDGARREGSGRAGPLLD